METCNEHSGFCVELRNHSETLAENKAQLQRVHQRIDDLVTGQTKLHDHFMEKLKEYADQMSAGYERTMMAFTDNKDGIITGENGAIPRITECEKNISLAWRVILFIFAPLALGVIGYIGAKIGKWLITIL